MAELGHLTKGRGLGLTFREIHASGVVAGIWGGSGGRSAAALATCYATQVQHTPEGVHAESSRAAHASAGALERQADALHVRALRAEAAARSDAVFADMTARSDAALVLAAAGQQRPWRHSSEAEAQAQQAASHATASFLAQQFWGRVSQGAPAPASVSQYWDGGDVDTAAVAAAAAGCGVKRKLDWRRDDEEEWRRGGMGAAPPVEGYARGERYGGAAGYYRSSYRSCYAKRPRRCKFTAHDDDVLLELYGKWAHLVGHGMWDRLLRDAHDAGHLLHVMHPATCRKRVDRLLGGAR
jgi:hypothetical protein